MLSAFSSSPPRLVPAKSCYCEFSRAAMMPSSLSHAPTPQWHEMSCSLSLCQRWNQNWKRIILVVLQQQESRWCSYSPAGQSKIEQNRDTPYSKCLCGVRHGTTFYINHLFVIVMFRKLVYVSGNNIGNIFSPKQSSKAVNSAPLSPLSRVFPAQHMMLTTA